jgi:hypothetical protein
MPILMTSDLWTDNCAEEVSIILLL